MRRGICIPVRVALADCSNVRDLKKRAHHGLCKGGRKRKGTPMSFRSFDTPMRQRHGVWDGVST